MRSDNPKATKSLLSIFCPILLYHLVPKWLQFQNPSSLSADCESSMAYAHAHRDEPCKAKGEKKSPPLLHSMSRRPDHGSHASPLPHRGVHPERGKSEVWEKKRGCVALNTSRGGGGLLNRCGPHHDHIMGPYQLGKPSRMAPHLLVGPQIV